MNTPQNAQLLDRRPVRVALAVGAAAGVSCALATAVIFYAADTAMATGQGEVLGTALLAAIAVQTLGVCFLSGVAYLVTRRRTRLLLQLADTAHCIAGGEFNVDAPDTQRRDELGHLARAFGDMAKALWFSRAEIEESHQRLRQQNDELQRANEVLDQLAITDGLTKLHNHRFFQDHFGREMKRADRTQEALALILVDVDNFKTLNDRFGHATGDAVLVLIATVLSESVRKSDLVARFGGDEFAIVASGTDLAGAVQVAEKVRMGLADRPVVVRGGEASLHATVSVGVAQYLGDAPGFFDRADRALYRAKESGKNCVSTDGDGPIL